VTAATLDELQRLLMVAANSAESPDAQRHAAQAAGMIVAREVGKRAKAARARDVRSWCSYCSESGHLHGTCPRRAADQERVRVHCNFCGEWGHREATCLKRAAENRRAEAVTPWTILGLQQRANAADVRRARRDAALKYHPDRPGGDLAKMAAANEAADQLETLQGNGHPFFLAGLCVRCHGPWRDLLRGGGQRCPL